MRPLSLVLVAASAVVSEMSDVDLDAVIEKVTIMDSGNVHARRERQVDRYRNRLQDAVGLWARRHQNRRLTDPDRRRVALENLRLNLSRLGRQHLPRAYRTGAGIRRLRPDDVITIAAELMRNEDFLAGSFIPYMERELDKGEEDDMTVGGMVVQRGFAWETRIGLYAGLYWTTIIIGFGSRVQPRNIPVQRTLNPLASHCNTCPGKADVYSSWDTMLAFTGGLPGDGSDQCHSNCRCQVEALIDGEWSTEP